MTSPLHKSRQITQPNIRLSTVSDRWKLVLAALLIGACSSFTYADDAIDAKAAKKSPLERLRLRSAFARWGELKQRLNPLSQRSSEKQNKPSSFQYPILLSVPEPSAARAPSADESTNIPIALDQPAVDQPAVEEPAVEEPSIDYFTETAIGEIQPFFDYEPQRVAQQERDCETICPCADGSDCRKPGGNKKCPCPEDDIGQPWIVKTYKPRAFDEEIFNWNASDIYSYPLYFEDKALERYGHTHCEALQPLWSVRRFGGQLALLPYQMAFKPPHKKRYALGYYRPGEWAPKLHYQIPLNAKAALVQAGVVTGAFLIFP